MRQGFEEVQNNTDENGNPAGGCVVGTGIMLQWQDGPLGRGGDRVEPNGAFVEDVIEAALQRIQHYQEAQGGKFWCTSNEEAILHLLCALDHLDDRTQEREARQVEGTHQV